MTGTRQAVPERTWPLGDPALRAIGVGVSKDPNAKVTMLFFGEQNTTPTCCCKVPTTDRAEQALRAEARALRALHERDLGGVARTIPRVLTEPVVGGRRCLALSGLPGTPMVRDYNAWGHTADPSAVEADFAAVRGWLFQLWAATGRGSRPVDVAARTLLALEERFGGHPLQNAVLGQLAAIARRLSGVETPVMATHGDLWYGNLLCEDGHVTGALDWESAAACGEPAGDLVRFALSYALYLDRHTRHGRRVRGHPGLCAGRFGAGIEYVLRGRGWLPGLVRDFLQQGLRHLGMPPTLWCDLALVGVAEAAATADHPGFAASHLELFDRLVRGVRMP